MTETLTKRYHLQEAIGKGGMGIVYRAIDRLTGEKVAFKRVLISQHNDPNLSTSQETLDYRLALADEFRTLASLRHPHIIAVLDYGFDNERQPFYTMEYLEEAETIVAYAQSQDEEGKLRLWVQMLQALAYLHRQGIIHRDLKPANVLVTAAGHVKVLDFGLATHRDSTPTITIGGTLSYMPPEILLEQPPSVQSDLYTAGIIACELFLGKNPVHHPEMMTLVANILHNTVDITSLPTPLQPIIHQLLDKNPQERYPSAESVLDALRTTTPYTIATESQSIRESFLRASTFVGREAELAQLMVAFFNILSLNMPQGKLWLIGGESGVGKSRLVDEVRIRAMTQGALVLRGQASKEANSLFQIWREPLRRLILEMTSIAPDTMTTITEILHDTPIETKRQTYANAILEVFGNSTIPIILILEDLHWADAEIPLLARLSNNINTKPLLIIATYRDDEAPYLPEDLPNAELLKLNRLDKEAIRQLTASMLGKIGESPIVVDLLDRETEGNAYFIVEVVRVLAEDAGSLSDIGNRTLPEKVFAGGIRTVVKRRLDRVPETYRPLLRLASVIGRWIDLPLLEALTSEDISVPLWLIECINAAILDIHDNRWRFAHEKLREAILEELSPDQLRQAHADIAYVIQKVCGDDPNYIVKLAYHFGQAGIWETAASYTIRAGDALNAISNYTKTISLCEHILPYIQDRDLRIRLIGVYTTALYRISEYRKLEAPAKEALALINEDETYNAIVGQLMLYFGWGYQHLGEYDKAQFHFDRSYHIYQELSDIAGIVRALHGRATIALVFGDLELSLLHNDRALSLSQDINDKQGIADSYNNRAIVYYMRQEYSLFLEMCHKALALFEELGELRGISMIQNNLAMCYHLLKDFAQSEHYHRQSIAISQQLNDKRMTYNTQINLSFMLLEQNPQNIEARHLLYQVIANSKQRPNSSVHLEAMSGLAHVLYYEGNYQKSAQIVGALLDHDNIIQEIITYRINPLLTLLKDKLGEQALADAIKSGEQCNFNELVSEVLALYAIYDTQ